MEKTLGTTKADRVLKIIRGYLIPTINELQGAITDLRARINALEQTAYECHCDQETNG